MLSGKPQSSPSSGSKTQTLLVRSLTSSELETSLQWAGAAGAPDQVDLGLCAGAAHEDGEHMIRGKILQSQRGQACCRQAQRYVHCLPLPGIHAAT